MYWELIESDDALANLLKRYKGSNAVMVDTEFMRRNTFYPQVALLQLCFEDGSEEGAGWLVDPLKISDLQPLRELLGDAAVIKVLHSASEDLEVFQRWLGVLPQPLFDTQKAAALCGMEFGLGYRNTVLALCDEDLPKGETRSDWLQRPLSESQCDYAAMDVTWLLAVYRKLGEQCRSLGRFDWVLEEGESACRGLASDSGDFHKRIKQAWKLNPLQLATLIAICEWREAMARELDKPRGWVIDDQACMQVARLRPASMADMRSRVELAPGALRRYGEQLLDLVAAQSALPADQLPQPLPPPLDGAQRDRLKQLKQKLDTIAGAIGVAPQALLSGRDLEVLLRDPAAGVQQWQGWRKELVITPLSDYLRGQAS